MRALRDERRFEDLSGLEPLRYDWPALRHTNAKAWLGLAVAAYCEAVGRGSCPANGLGATGVDVASAEDRPIASSCVQSRTLSE